MGLFEMINNIFDPDKMGSVFGVVMMGVILALAIASLVFFIERYVFLFVKSNLDKDRFLSHVKRAVLSGDLNSAVNYCNDRSAPLNNVVKAGLTAVMNKGTDDDVQTSMDVAALREIPRVERRTPFLALFANIATLMGLLTTIVGLIGGFEAMREVEVTDKAAALAGSIAVAMNGTAFGLIVAIPSLLAFAFLNAKAQRILDDLHEGSVSLLNMIIQNRDKFNK